MSKKKTAPKKSVAKKALSKRSKKAVPPPDNPLLRYEELNLDRITGDDVGIEEAAESMTAVAAISRKRGAVAPKGRKVSTESEVMQTARLRLAAMQQSKAMPDVDEGSPVMSVPTTEADYYVTSIPGMEGVDRAALAPTPGDDNILLVAPVPGTSNWVQMGPTAIPKGQTYSAARVLVTGRVTSIIIDPTNPQIIYIGAAQGGVWKTSNGGKDWAPKSDNEVSLAIGALAIDPTNHLVLYAGTGEGNFAGDSYYGNGVLKTINGGTSWTLFAQPTFTGTRFSRIAVTPGAPNRLFAATGKGIYRSTDGGMTWTQMTNGLPAIGGSIIGATDVAIDPSNPNVAYAAFWAGGIFKTINASAANPLWTKLIAGLPAAGFSRIALGISASSPQTVYALMADGGGNQINQFFRTTNAGTNWSAIPLPGGNIGGQGFYNINVAVDPTTPDIVYLSGISVWKATRSMANVWTITNVAATIHPDNHAFAIDPTNHLVVYAGNDGGIYKSTNGGATWSDTINEGPCITQFEFIADHPFSDAVVFGGTQDNGTEQFRNSPVFNHADDGDGGYTAVSRTQPQTIFSTYFGNTPKRSLQGGKFGTWAMVNAGIAGGGLVYPPMTLNDTNSNNIAFGTDRINLDPTQGTGGWPTKVTLPGITGLVSAIHYVNSNLIYAGTTSGKVYRLVNTGVWTATVLHAPPLPARWIWDVAAVPGNPNVVIVVMSGFGTPHVWRGNVPAIGPAAWTNISGTGAGILPDIPVNALAIDPIAPNTYYIATDVAVYRTTNAGTTWTQFSQGLPNVAVFDMRLNNPTRLLRVATHGRGMWERKLDVLAMPNVDIFVRDHLMDTGRFSPSPEPVTATFEDPLQHVSLGDSLRHWMCADIKVDALEGLIPSYQMNVANVDYVAYESKLEHRNAQRGKVNRIYVQVHNRGIQAAAGVVVKVLYANASAGLPPLPPDFWTAFPGNSVNTTNWKPIGAAKVIASLSPTEPTVLEWDWTTPLNAATHSCLLVVTNCPANPIPAANKVFNVDQLVRNEKRVGLKNLFVVNAPPAASSWTTIEFFAEAQKNQAIRIVPSTAGGATIGILLPKTAQVAKPSKAGRAKKGRATAVLQGEGIVVKKLSDASFKSLKDEIGDQVDKYDRNDLRVVESLEKGAKLTDIKVPKTGLQALVLLTHPAKAGDTATFSIVQEDGEEVVGGCTFVLRAVKQT